MCIDIYSKYLSIYFSVAASKIHKFPTSFMKLALEIKLLLEFTVLKTYIGICYKAAQNIFKVNNKDTRTASIGLAPASIL